MPWKYIIALLVVVLAGSSILVLSAPPAAPAGGTITGKVTYTGTPPKMKPIDMSKEPVCNQQHNPPEKTQTVVTGPGDALEYVVVYISAGDKAAGPPSAGLRYDQKGCMYTPHVIALMVGQQLQVLNSDATTHNIHPTPTDNREWNKSQPPNAPPIVETFARPEVAIPVKCNVHPWMKGYFAVLANPLFSVTAKDGKFEIKGVPPGTYTVEAWQEKYGVLDQTVTVAASQAATSDFTFKAGS